MKDKLAKININKNITKYLFSDNNINYNQFWGIAGVLPFFMNTRLISTHNYIYIVLLFDVYLLNIIRKELQLKYDNTLYYMLQNLILQPKKNNIYKDINIHISDMNIEYISDNTISICNFNEPTIIDYNLILNRSILDSDIDLPVINKFVS